MNRKLRKYLRENFDSVLMLDPDHCDEGIIGMIGSRVVYGYDELVSSYAKAFRKDAESDEDAYQMGVDWVEYNTIRSLPYQGAIAPILAIFDPEREVYVNLLDTRDSPRALRIRFDIPGIKSRNMKNGLCERH